MGVKNNWKKIFRNIFRAIWEDTHIHKEKEPIKRVGHCEKGAYRNKKVGHHIKISGIDLEDKCKKNRICYRVWKYKTKGERSDYLSKETQHYTTRNSRKKAEKMDWKKLSMKWEILLRAERN